MAQWLVGMPAETHLSLLAMVLGGVFDKVDPTAADLLRARRRLVRVLAGPAGQRVAPPRRHRRHLAAPAVALPRPLLRRLGRLRRARAAAARRPPRRRTGGGRQRLPVPAGRTAGRRHRPRQRAAHRRRTRPHPAGNAERFLGGGTDERPAGRASSRTRSTRPTRCPPCRAEFHIPPATAGASRGRLPRRQLARPAAARRPRAVLEGELADWARLGVEGARRGRAALVSLPRAAARPRRPARRRAAATRSS